MLRFLRFGVFSLFLKKREEKYENKPIRLFLMPPFTYVSLDCETTKKLRFFVFSKENTRDFPAGEESRIFALCEIPKEKPKIVKIVKSWFWRNLWNIAYAIMPRYIGNTYKRHKGVHIMYNRTQIHTFAEQVRLPTGITRIQEEITENRQKPSKLQNLARDTSQKWGRFVRIHSL